MVKAEDTLTVGQAFRAAFLFLEANYESFNRTGDELPTILSDMLILPEDGMPADPGAWQWWVEAVERVLRDSRDIPKNPWVFQLTRRE